MIALLLALAQDHIVIAPDKFHPALREYVRHKNEQLKTELQSLEALIKTQKGADDAEKVKRYLHTRWKNGAKYVLLVGDADVFPVRYMVLDRITKEAFDTAFYPSDLYYADVAKADGSFEDWNGKKDAYFGEVRGEKNKKDPINYDGIDYKPELAVGRWPVSTPDEVKIVVAKTIAYETAKTRQKKSALLYVEGWVDTRELLDGLATKLDAEKMYKPSEDELVKLLNEGLGLVAHTGHGSDDSWAGAFSTGSIAKLKNGDRLPVMFSAGCSTARFATLPPYEGYIDSAGKEHKGSNNGQVFTEAPPYPACYQKGKHNYTGLGEQLLRAGPNGAIAYIGCNTGSQPCALTLLEGFVSEFPKSARLGDAWVRAIAFYYEKEKLAGLKPNDDWYPPSIFFQGMKFMLFGDPTLKLTVEGPEAHEIWTLSSANQRMWTEDGPFFQAATAPDLIERDGKLLLVFGKPDGALYSATCEKRWSEAKPLGITGAEPSIVEIDGGLRLYYRVGDDIRSSVSKNGATWEAEEGVRISGFPDPEVVKFGGEWYLFSSAGRLARSKDGLAFEKDAKFEMAEGTIGAIAQKDRIKLWHCSRNGLVIYSLGPNGSPFVETNLGKRGMDASPVQRADGSVVAALRKFAKK